MVCCELELAKKMIDHSILYISDYFIDLRSHVDLAFVQILSNNNNDLWLKMINKINSFEMECIKNERIFIRQNSECKQNDNDESSSSSLNLIKNEEKRIFQNRSILFLEKLKLNRLYWSEIFNETDSFKLVIINDDYLSSSDFIVNSHQTMITNESIKIECLKQKLIKSKNDQIIELNLSLKDNLKEIILKMNIFNLNKIEYESINELAFNGFECLESIDLSNNSIKIIPTNLFKSNLHYLKQLNLSYNSIEIIQFETFINLDKLTILRLNNNKLKTMISLIGLKSLKELYLYSNRIEFVDSKIFKENNQLEILSLASNRINLFDHQLLKEIKFIDLRFNNNNNCNK